MRAAICDDERAAQEHLVTLLELYAHMRRVPIDYTVFSDYADLLQVAGNYDVFFVDYMMPGIDGLRFAQMLREQYKNKTIIFVSSYDEIVYDTFAVQTHRFLQKPVQKDKLFEAMDAVLNVTPAQDQLVIRDSGFVNVLNTEDILYITVSAKDCVVCTPSEQLLCRRTVESMEQELIGYDFFRIHRAYLVNMRAIRQFDHRFAELVNGEKLPISTRRYAQFSKAYLKMN